MSRTVDVPAGPNTFLQRIIGAMALDRAIYEEVEADRTATTQAFAVVLLSSLSAGLGAGSGFAAATVTNIIFFTIVALLSWAAWALVTLQIGTRLMPEPQTRAGIGELLRTLGFATAPGLLNLLGMMPGITTSVFAVSSVWMLASMVVAVRHALDYTSTARAIAVCVVGWALAIGLALLLGSLFGPRVT